MNYLNNFSCSSYQIYEFLSERTFVVNLNMSLCFESSGCFLHEVLFKDTKLPKPLCDYGNGFLLKGNYYYKNALTKIHKEYYDNIFIFDTQTAVLLSL